MCDVVGALTLVVQSGAALEIVHAAAGFTRSSVPKTVMQVASRLFTVWVVVYNFATAGRTPFYAIAILAWSITEVFRYTFYVVSLLGIRVPMLEYIRYVSWPRSVPVV